MQRITKEIIPAATAVISTSGILFSHEALELGRHQYGGRAHIFVHKDNRTAFDLLADDRGHKISKTRSLSVKDIEEYLAQGEYTTEDGKTYFLTAPAVFSAATLLTDEAVPQDEVLPHDSSYHNE